MAELTGRKTRRGGKWFQRPDGPPPGIRPTDDDIALFLHLYRHRVLSHNSIFSLFPNRSEDHLRERLRNLWWARYLDRGSDGRSLEEKLSGEPLVINNFLGREGAKKLRSAKEEYALQADRLTALNRSIKPLSIRHEERVSRFAVQLEVACRERDDFELLYPDQFAGSAQRFLTSPGKKQKLETPVRWRNYSSESEALVMDKAVAIRRPHPEFGRADNYLFVEIDLDNEVVAPSVSKQESPHFWTKQSSMLKKFIIYACAFQRREMFKKKYGIPSFRVLTITTTPGHAETIRRRAVEEEVLRFLPPYLNKRVPPGLFLFSDFETIEAAGGNPLAVEYFNGVGKAVSLAH